MYKTLTMPQQPSLFDDSVEFMIDFDEFPKTRYQGSKRRLLSEMYGIFSRFPPTSAIDLYSGTSTVSLLLARMGWSVVANDFLLYNNATARALLGAFAHGLTATQARADLQYLLHDAPVPDEPLVCSCFAGIYFHDDENLQIDRFCQNVRSLAPKLRDLYVYAVGQSLLMKRPYNLFHRANLNMRTRSVERSFGNVATWNTPIIEHAFKIISKAIKHAHPGRTNSAVFNCNTLDLNPLPDAVDLVYLDPPYLNRNGVGVDYCSFYHFLDGLCDYDLFRGYNDKYPHRPIVANPSAWHSESGAIDELTRILRKWPKSTIVLSYRSDGRPNYEAIAATFRDEGRQFQTTDAHNFKYALSDKEDTKELFLISSPG